MLITRTARDRYQFDGLVFQPDGHVILTDFASARKLAAQMSAVRTQPVPASDLYALSLIDEALRVVVGHFAPPALMDNAVSHVDQQLGIESVTATEKRFISEFPPEAVYRGDEQVEEYLQKITNGRIKTIEELIYVFTHNTNPAVEPLVELVDDKSLEPTAYKNLMAFLNTFFAKTAKEDPQKQGRGESLFEILRAPFEVSPNSLEGQLRFIVDKWQYLLGENFVTRIVRG